MYNEILQAIIEMAATASGERVVTGSLPPDEGIAMIGQAAQMDIALDMGSADRMTIVCNGKSADQQTVIGWLDSIHRSLTRRKDFPSSSGWQVYAIRTLASPRLLSREQNKYWLYGSSLEISFYTKGLIQ